MSKRKLWTPSAVLGFKAENVLHGANEMIEVLRDGEEVEAATVDLQ